ncbi:hypothetical protein J6590_077482 [Homalodisca vitripennis]|nr:hypothetical protein J6590_077482 [Homalodisca vitripennis]
MQGWRRGTVHLAIVVGTPGWGTEVMMPSSNGHLVEMEKWSGVERAVAVRAYNKNGDSITAAQRVFQRHYDIPPRGRIPSSHAISSCVRNFEETGSTLKKNLLGDCSNPRKCCCGASHSGKESASFCSKNHLIIAT